MDSAEQPIKRALIFPGFRIGKLTGMGKDLAEAFPNEAGAVFAKVDGALGFKLSTLMFEGPEEKLKLLENRLPAMFALNMVLMSVIESRARGLGVWDALKNSFVGYAGHSFGEYSALCAGGSIDFDKTVLMMRDSGRSMDRDLLMQSGAMAIIFSGDPIPPETAREIADVAAAQATAETGKEKLCVIVNDNAPNQIVLSGHKEAIEHVKEIAARYELIGRKFNENVPAHSPLMRNGVKILRGHVAKLQVKVPGVPFISGCTAQFENSPRDIRRMMAENVAVPVMWQDTLRFLGDQGVTQVIECGDQLSSFVSVAEPRISAVPLKSPAQIDDFLKSLIEPGTAIAAGARARAMDTTGVFRPVASME